MSTPPDPSAARSVAHAILSRPEFAPPYVSPLDRLQHWVGREVAGAVDAVLSGRFSPVGVVVLGAILAAGVWLVARGAGAVRRDRVVGGVAVGAGRRPPTEWLAEAVACERRGDWKAALRARYRALVAELARRGMVADVDGRTSGEYRLEVARALPGAAGEFGGATDLFEVAVYGDGPAGPAESARIQELAGRVLAATG